MDVRAGLAGGLSTCAPLALGVATGEPEIGVTACFGGLNAALAVPRGGLRERVGWGSGAALASCLSVAIATAVQDSVAASVVAAFAVVGLAAFMRAFGHDGALAGFVVGAIFVITNGLPAGTLDVGERVLWFAAGSAAGVVLMTLAYAGARSSARPEPQLGDPLLRAHALRLASIVAGDDARLPAARPGARLLGPPHDPGRAPAGGARQRRAGRAARRRHPRRNRPDGPDRGLHRRGVGDGGVPGPCRVRPLLAVRAGLFLARGADHADGPAHRQRG